MTTVSVVIPTYNRSSLVVDAIQSVLGQTFKDFEILVVDDGSTDDTADVLAPLIRSQAIRYIYQVNRGESAARNHGIHEARGRYITFLDSDDLWMPEKLALQISCIESHPDAGLVQAFFSKFDHLTGNDLGIRETTWFAGWIYPGVLMHWNELMAVDTVLVPLKVLEHVGGFDESIRWGQDLELWWRISRKYPLVVIPQVLARVRVHPNSLSAAKADASAAFRFCLEKAFANDPSLSSWFRRRALARMYAYMGYNQLGNSTRAQLQYVWRDCWSALSNWPFESNAYLCLLLSLVPFQMRTLLYQSWRDIRYE